MLTPEQVAAVSRNILGHMTTDPAVRAKLDIDPNSPGAAATLASAINAATLFSPPVTAEDVPAIVAQIKAIVQQHPVLAPVNAVSFSIFFKTS
jgi:hypothetical protein